MAPPSLRVLHRISGVITASLLALAAVAAAAPVILPDEDGVLHQVAAAAIFAASYAALAIGKVPGLSIDRAGIALVGACLMVACDALPLEAAYRAIDLDTITLLLGMMIIVANLRLSGFFGVVTSYAARWANRPVVLLAAISLLSGVSSAFLVNDAICLVLAPLVLEMVVALGRNPVPYLLAVAMASNVGSTATITGNPQNIIIGSLSGIPYASFAAALAPVAAAGLAVTVLLLVLGYWRELHRHPRESGKTAGALPEPRYNRALLLRAAAATAAVIGLFFAGQPPAKAAIIVGGLLLLTRRVRSRRIYDDIDWSLLLMFSGLFIIVAGTERALVTPQVLASVGALRLDQPANLAVVTAILSNLVSNVPAVLMLKPFVANLPDHVTAWLVIAMASTLAGNFTILGSVANLIVVEKAARRGVVIGFWDFMRVGAPLTLVTILIGVFWLGR